MTAPRLQLADELLRRLAAALRSAQLYSKGHPIIARNLEALSAAVQLLHALEPSIVIGIVGDEIDRRRHADREGGHARAAGAAAAAGAASSASRSTAA